MGGHVHLADVYKPGPNQSNLCSETPNRLAKADFFVLRVPNNPSFSVEAAKKLSSPTCLSRSLIFLTNSLVTPRVSY